MRLEPQVKVSRTAGVPLYSRMGPVVIKLLQLGSGGDGLKNDNRIVMECYYQSEPRKIGYRKRMHQLWLDREMFPVTEQRLLDQKSQIVRKQWLSRLELEEIASAVEDREYGDIGGDLEQGEAERLISQDEPDIQTERDRTENDVFCLKERVDVTEEEICLLQRLNEMRKMDRTRLPALRGIESDKLQKAIKKIDVLLGKIKVDDITDVSDLIYCASAVVVEDLGVKCEGGKKSKEPWWKRRLEGQVKQLNKDLGRVNASIEKKSVKEKYKDELERKYKIRRKDYKLRKKKYVKKSKLRRVRLQGTKKE